MTENRCFAAIPVIVISRLRSLKKRVLRTSLNQAYRDSSQATNDSFKKRVLRISLSTRHTEIIHKRLMTVYDCFQYIKIPY
jgi:hypothetical protein